MKRTLKSIQDQEVLRGFGPASWYDERYHGGCGEDVIIVSVDLTHHCLQLASARYLSYETASIIHKRTIFRQVPGGRVRAGEMRIVHSNPTTANFLPAARSRLDSCPTPLPLCSSTNSMFPAYKWYVGTKGEGISDVC
jgi:hypothetical protein